MLAMPAACATTATLPLPHKVRLTKQRGLMLFLSSRTNETSRENPYGRNGQFTRYLLRGLKGGADNNRNRIVEAKELFDFVAVNVAKATKGKQHPVMWGRFDNNMHVMNWNPKR